MSGGIAGFCDFSENFLASQEKNEAIATKMLNTIAYRELSGSIYYSRNTVMSVSKKLTYKGNDYFISMDGELYNKAELISLAKASDSSFVKSDSSLILFLFARLGTSFVNMLNGVYSIVIYDSGNNTLYLFRDRFGTKPLFYTFAKNTLVFASQIKALLQYPGIKAELNQEGLCELFGLGPGRSLGNGVFANIHEVLPGHFLVASQSGVAQEKYWDFHAKEHTETYGETVAHVSELLRDSIARQATSVYPVCSLLSGGIDSTVVTAIAAGIFKEQGKILNTYSFDFEGNEENFAASEFQPDKDRPWAIEAAKFLGTNQSFLVCSDQELYNELFNSVLAKDLPGMADIDSSLLHFCKKITPTYKVALTGECSDELFGGYPWFHKEEMLHSTTFPWSQSLERRTFLLKPSLQSKLSIEGYVKEKYEKTILQVPILDGESDIDTLRRQIQYLTVKWFMVTLLDRMERAASYSGLIARVPFLDHRVAEYAFNVPWSFKSKDGIPKQLLREAFKGVLPQSLLDRKKSPFPKTYSKKYEGLLAKGLMNIIDEGKSPLLDLIDKRKLLEFIEAPKDLGKPWYGQLMAGPQMLAYLLQVDFWLREYNVSIKI